MSKLLKWLYNISRKTGKAASELDTLESLTKGPGYFFKRCIRRKVAKTGWKAINKINKKFK